LDSNATDVESTSGAPWKAENGRRESAETLMQNAYSQADKKKTFIISKLVVLLNSDATEHVVNAR